ncbi:hypothetical protein [Acetobacterium malicum]|uniref:hypothetical protein n=1 Tax=Acetobacterium malicum TaxID=52692 RepID=UPI001FAC7A83|nr:hypothetical protein [Acetobacterium malicum]
MRYIVTGADGQLGGRVAANMLNEVSGDQLIFTCPDLSRLRPERVKIWKEKGVTIKEANYDNKDQMIETFKGGDRIYFVSGVIIGVNFHIISDWINHNKSDEKGSNNAKIVAC